MLKNKFLIAVIVGLLFSFGCNQQEQVSGTGILQGKVTIGPLCPVETDPPDPNCQPTEETYKAWPIAVFSTDRKRQIVELHPNLDGTYEMELPSGNYQVDLENRSSSRVGGSNLPAFIQINAGDTTHLDIDIDTGIR